MTQEQEMEYKAKDKKAIPLPVQENIPCFIHSPPPPPPRIASRHFKVTNTILPGMWNYWGKHKIYSKCI